VAAAFELFVASAFLAMSLALHRSVRLPQADLGTHGIHYERNPRHAGNDERTDQYLPAQLARALCRKLHVLHAHVGRPMRRHLARVSRLHLVERTDIAIERAQAREDAAIGVL